MEPTKEGPGSLFDEEDDLFRPALEVGDFIVPDELLHWSRQGISDEINLDGDEEAAVKGARLQLDNSSVDNQATISLAGDNTSDAVDQINGITEPQSDRCISSGLSEVDMSSETTTHPSMPFPSSTLNRPAVLSVSSEPDNAADEPLELRINIDIDKYEKRGEGVAAYMVYKVVTKIPSSVPGFSKKEYVAWRRFSDFLGLHDKLYDKYLPHGRIVPPAPAKNVFVSTKTKMVKGTVEEDPVAAEFLERRRASLERYIRRTADHPVLLRDPDFQNFITFEGELPKASQTAVISGTTIKRIWDRVSEGFNRIAISKMDENDAWFNERHYEVEQLEIEMRKLLAKAESLVSVRKEYSVATEGFCKCLSMLTACEENTSLSRALSLLCETMENVSQLQNDQADKDFFILYEMLKDYVALIEVVKEVFFERVKAWNGWQNALQTLTKKRETKSRYELAGKTDRIPQALKEVEEWEQKSDDAEQHFHHVSSSIQKEYKRFDQHRVKEFKQMLIHLLETVAGTQQQVSKAGECKFNFLYESICILFQLAKCWETFIPDARAIL
ncbi:sorting nexin 2 [Trichuris trichiura]|uniref:Sorting nexin 2 n=1 Tax=Trichuris trichiura TaxID=36087 RepID=A0A077ZAH0_TRITR|nr:sorting nexin 2 [Trichuris trichiura]